MPTSSLAKAPLVPDQPSADVKLRQLQILREVLRTGSARYAARLLKVSQPAVSQHIKQLETTLGLPLFLREKNRLVPTHQAWELLRDIEVAFASLDKVGKSIAALKGEEPTAVGLAAPGIFCFELLPRALGALRAHASQIREPASLEERIREWAREEGAAIGVEAAEAHRVIVIEDDEPEGPQHAHEPETASAADPA